MDHEYSHQFYLDDKEINEVSEIGNENTENEGSDELLIDAVRGYPHLYNASLNEGKFMERNCITHENAR